MDFLNIAKSRYSVRQYSDKKVQKDQLDKILEAIAFTDKIIFGRTNYNKEVSGYTTHRDFYDKQALSVISFCKERNIQYHIKHGTLSETVKEG
jgi:nitroreductase